MKRFLVVSLLVSVVMFSGCMRHSEKDRVENTTKAVSKLNEKSNDGELTIDNYKKAFNNITQYMNSVNRAVNGKGAFQGKVYLEKEEVKTNE